MIADGGNDDYFNGAARSKSHRLPNNEDVGVFIIIIVPLLQGLGCCVRRSSDSKEERCTVRKL